MVNNQFQEEIQELTSTTYHQ